MRLIEIKSGFFAVTTDILVAIFTRNFSLAQESLDHTKSLLVSLNQGKAFDCDKHGYLFDVLSRFGFAESSFGLFRALYNDMLSHLSLAGTRRHRKVEACER